MSKQIISKFYILVFIVFMMTSITATSCTPINNESVTTNTLSVQAAVEPTVKPTVKPTEVAEQAESEIVIEGLTGVKPDFLLNGNLKINKEMGEKFYDNFLDALAKNKQNEEYMVELLGENPDGTKLLDYLKKNDYILSAGLNLPYRYTAGYVRMGRNPIKEEIKLDTVKGVAFGPNEWNGNTAGITDYVSSLKTYGSLWVTEGTYTFQYLGWGIDPEDNRLVFVAGAKTLPPVDKYPWTKEMAVGGEDGNFDFDRDSKVVLGEWLQTTRLLRTYKDQLLWQVATPFGGTCDSQISSAVCNDDVEEFLGGGGASMFEPVR